MQSYRKKAIAALSIVMCVVMFVVGTNMGASANPGSRYQGQINDINNQMANLDRERQRIEAAIANARGEAQQARARRDNIDSQMRITREEIALLEQRIEILEAYIEAQIEEIAEKQAEIDANHALFLARTRAMFVQDDASTLGLLLGADSFVSFLTRTDSMVRIAEHDRRLGQMLIEQRLEMEEARAALEATLDDLEYDRDRTEERRQLLTRQLQEANSHIHSIEQTEREFVANYQSNRAMRDQMQREIEDLLRRIELSRNPYVGGEMAWPVPGFYRITSNFGPRFGGRDFHTGIDISGSGIHGATVVAANTGTVRFTNWSHTPGRGYGIFVILDHGGGVTTLYAHLSNITVSVGDVVTIGDPIGSVGSTGWSTGPHLHFEVRHGGTAVDPRPYIIGRAR